MAIRVTCTNCGAAYKIDESKIPASGGAIKCQNCGTRFAVMRPPPEVDDSAATVIAKVPLPQPMAPEATPTSPSLPGPDSLFGDTGSAFGGDSPLGDGFDNEKTMVGMTMPVAPPTAEQTQTIPPIALGGEAPPPPREGTNPGFKVPAGAIPLGGEKKEGTNPGFKVPAGAIPLGGEKKEGTNPGFKVPAGAIPLGGEKKEGTNPGFKVPAGAIPLGGEKKEGTNPGFKVPAGAIPLGGEKKEGTNPGFKVPAGAIPLGGEKKEGTNPGFKVPAGVAGGAIPLGGEKKEGTNPGFKVPAGVAGGAIPLGGEKKEGTNPGFKVPAGLSDTAKIPLGGEKKEGTNPGFKVPAGVAETAKIPLGETTNPGIKAPAAETAKIPLGENTNPTLKMPVFSADTAPGGENTNPTLKMPVFTPETIKPETIKPEPTNPGIKTSSLTGNAKFASMSDEPTNPMGRAPTAPIALPSTSDVMSDDTPIQLTDDDDIFAVDESAATQIAPRPQARASAPLDLPLDLPAPSLDLGSPSRPLDPPAPPQPLDLSSPSRPLDPPAPLDLAPLDLPAPASQPLDLAALDLPAPASQPLDLPLDLPGPLDLPEPTAAPLDLPAPLELGDTRDRANDFDDLPAPSLGGAPMEPSDLPDFDKGATVIAPRPAITTAQTETLREVTGPSDLPRPLSSEPADLPTQQLDDGVPEPLEASIPEPAPSLGIDQMPDPLDVPEPMAPADLGGPLSVESLSESLEADVPPPQKSNRRVLLLGGVLALMLVGAFATSYLMTGLWPWELLNPPPAPPPQAASAPVLPPVPPAPDLAAIESKDLSAYRKALAVLEERKAARKARNQSAEDKEDDPARAKLLWHGAMLLGSKALGELLESDPAVLAEPSEGVHPHIERAQAALAFLKGKPAEMDTILDKLLARDKGDNDALLIRGYAKLAASDTIAASKAFDDVLKINAKNVDALLGHADVARRAQDRDGAASYVEQAEAASPDNARVKLARAELQLEDAEARAQGRKALEALNKSADSLGERDRARLHFAVARIDAQAGLAQKARAGVQAAATEDQTAPILRALAWQHIFAGELDKAGAALQAASKADVDGGESFYLAKATLLSKQGMGDKLTELAKLGAMKGAEKRATLYVNGLAQEALNKKPAALKLYAASAKADKTFSWPVLADMRIKAQKPKLKLVRFALLAKTAADAPALAAYADTLLDDGQFKAATERYEQALEKDPWVLDLAAISTRYQTALQKSGRTQDAGKIAIANLTIDAKDVKAVLEATTMAKNAEAYDDAQRIVQSGLDEHPKDTALRIAQAEVMVARGNRDKARSLLQQLVKDEEKNPLVHEAMARSYHPQDPDMVKLHIKNAIQLNTNEARFHMLLGESYFAKNKYDEAHDAFERARELDPKNVDTLVHLSRTAELQNKKKEAVERMRDALKLDPTRRTLVLELGERLEDMDQRAEALKLYQDALKREPNQSDLLGRVGRVYQSNGNRAMAMKTYLLAAKANPSDPQVQYRLGYLYKDAGQNKPAIKAFEAYLKLAPKAEDRKDIETEIADLKK